jgi:hypothetical protein
MFESRLSMFIQNINKIAKNFTGINGGVIVVGTKQVWQAQNINIRDKRAKDVGLNYWNSPPLINC